MKKISKYPLDIGRPTTLELQPEAKFLTMELQPEAKFLTIRKQRDQMVAYFEIEIKKMVTLKTVIHEFYIVPTGMSFELPPEAEYVDTFMFDDEQFVCHVYQAKPVLKKV